MLKIDESDCSWTEESVHAVVKFPAAEIFMGFFVVFFIGLGVFGGDFLVWFFTKIFSPPAPPNVFFIDIEGGSVRFCLKGF